MALEDLRFEIEKCHHCGSCKFVLVEQIKSWRFSHVCPSIVRNNFHVYSGGGKVIMALSLIDGRIDLTENVADIIYKCALCGACDVVCKYNNDIDVNEILQALRSTCVEQGYVHPAFQPVINGLKKEDNMMKALKSDRGKWAEGLDVKDINVERAEVIFHAGCRNCFDEERWKVSRGAVNLLKSAGVDVGIAGKEETCCGGRAYEIGYEGELTKYAEHNKELYRGTKAKILVTSCADCYHSFKVLYDQIGQKLPLEVLHITEYLERLIIEGKIKPVKEVPMVVTYHDPCHLGRKGEEYYHWNGVIEAHPRIGFLMTEPPKRYRRGTYGVYEPPRNIIKSIPGLRLVEMERIKENAWCCGAGGGLRDSNPDMSMFTALERIDEAKATGAEALITCCPWCERTFIDAIGQHQDKLKVFDIVDLLEKAI